MLQLLPMRPRVFAILALVAVSLVGSQARATIIERVVAVVGERAILLSDLRQRARPYVVQIETQIPPGAARAAQMSQMLKLLLEKMVDEELERRAGNRARISVSAAEIDDSIMRIARQNELSYDEIVQEAVRTGLSETEYRQEIRRQVLEAKLLNLRVVARIRITEDDLKTTYQRIQRNERKRLSYRAAWIKIDASVGPKGASNRTLAEKLSKQAASGGDFAELARRHSDDAATRELGGLLGRVKPGAMPPAIDKVVLGLDVGQVSRPVRVGGSLYVLKLLEREPSQLPTFNEARGELRQRVYADKMDRARRHWLDGLRRRTHVDIRF